MATWHIALLLAYAGGMSIGQVLFKLAATDAFRASPGDATANQIVRLALNPYFAGAMLMYLLLSVMWVWILSFTPLSRAYPFVAAAFVATPLLGHLLFHEAIDLRFLLGLILIVCGLMLVVGREP